MRFCRWCSESGHNQRTCPKKKEYIENLRETNPQRAEIMASAYETRRKSCGYCGAVGHTIRKCDDFMSLVSSKLTEMIDFRKMILRVFEASGFGPGALLTCPIGYHEERRLKLPPNADGTSRESFIGVIEYINYEELIFKNSVPDEHGYAHSSPVRVICLENPSKKINVAVPAELFHSVIKQRSWGDQPETTVMSSPSAADIPADFLGEKLIRKRAYTWCKLRYTKNK